MDTKDIEEAKLKAKDLFDTKRCGSVYVVEMSEKAYVDYLRAEKEEDEYDLYDWQEEYLHKDVDVIFSADYENIPDEVYFRWQRAENNIEYAIYDHEHASGEKVEDGCSMQVGVDEYGDYWFAFDYEDEDIIEDDQSFHNSNGRDVRKWQDWYKKEWIITVNKPEIERLAKYENKGYKWVLKP